MVLPRVSLKTALLSVAIVTAIGGTVAALSWNAYASRAEVVAPSVVRPARVVEIAYERPIHALTLAGTVVPRIESTLGFRVAGKIVERLVDVGAAVQADQLIARLDPADLQLAVDNARAALAAAEADHMRAKADHDRYQQLRNTSVFTAQTHDQRKSVAATALGRMKQAESQLAAAENNLAYSELRADSAGVVTSVLAEVGQVMAQGQGVVRVARTNELEILVGVPEHRLNAVRAADEATFELWSDPGKRFSARLRELSPSADSLTRTYPARFSVLDKPGFIGLGMTATLTLGRPDGAPVAEVPLSAIFQAGSQPAVWVVDRQSGVVELRPVVVARWRNETAALGSGVRDGELVATAGVHKLEAGQRVRPMPQQQAER
ncbi:MAG: efflux RND transporter periplasmic adaptor subunit [Enhydrobacter sp.]|nr:MAG: efflux RND transporter periplasmic adaptor subunit [Enhydrobacter sp.]